MLLSSPECFLISRKREGGAEAEGAGEDSGGLGVGREASGASSSTLARGCS